MKKTIKAELSVLFACAVLYPALCQAYGMDITPFKVCNQSPLVKIYGLSSESSATVVPSGKRTLALTLDTASSSTKSTNDNEQISLDGELTRITTTLHYGFGNRFDAGISIPVINQSGGFLDQFIISWHDTLSLPQGERTSTPKNRLGYVYQKKDTHKLAMSKSDTVIGDIVLQGGMTIYDKQSDTSHTSAALRTDLKLPTGDSSILAGSGSTDLAVTIAGSYNRYGDFGTTGFFGSLGVLGMTRSDILPDQQNRMAVFGTLGTGWSPASWISFKLQLNGHSPLYHDSSLTELSSPALMLTTGGTLRIIKSYLLDIGVSEDIAVATAPDVAFHLGLKREF